jgi:zinc protease
MLAPLPTSSSFERRATEFFLANGMQVVVIPDHRAPVVTHMVWYKAGAADGPHGVSGIAHFLEHLMFKSTDKIPDGAFASTVLQLGGQLNAFTSQDVTAYHERIAREQLRAMMALEADRMTGLRLSDEEVATERQVIIEERRMRTDSIPERLLGEQMSAALYQAHPYRAPVIGWAHEMATLSRADALRFYTRYYAPNNAILVVAGDVTPDEVKRLAEETYGMVPANPQVEGRVRAQEPPHIAACRVTLKHRHVATASLHRAYFVPSYTTAQLGEAEALQVLMAILGDAATGRLYRQLVLAEKVAATASGGYSGSGLDSGSISLNAVTSDGDLDRLEAAVDTVLKGLRNSGVTQLELERAKTSVRADYIYQGDEQEQLANRYGWALATGRSIEHVEGWPTAIAKVTADDVRNAAVTYLDTRRSVTGWLLPETGAVHHGLHNVPFAKVSTP